MIMRHFGAEGLRAHLAETHAARAALRLMGGRERSVRAGPRRCPSASCASGCAGTPATKNTNASLDAINASGEIFLSHTKLDGRFVLRLAIGNINTTERHVARAWELLNLAAAH